MLTNAFKAMGVMRPATSPMSRQLISDWSQSLRRLAQEKVTKPDKSTILNALRTWNEFEEHLALRDREMRYVGSTTGSWAGRLIELQHLSHRFWPISRRKLSSCSGCATQHG